MKRSCITLHAVCSRMWSETRNRIYQFDKAVSEATIVCFLNYAYYGIYASNPYKPQQAAKQGPSAKSTSNDTSSSTREGPHKLLLHAQVYVFADTYIIPGLGQLAAKNIKDLLDGVKGKLWKSAERNSVLDLLEYAFENLREEDPLLIFLAKYASFKFSALRHSRDRFQAILLGSGGKFLKNLLPTLTGSFDDPCAIDKSWDFEKIDGFGSSRMPSFSEHIFNDGFPSWDRLRSYTPKTPSPGPSRLFGRAGTSRVPPLGTSRMGASSGSSVPLGTSSTSTSPYIFGFPGSSSDSQAAST